MAATVTASIASLILTLDDPDRDDLDSVTVWGSTTSGFTPSNANVVYKGKSLSITIANLTPLTTYYLKYAYISAIDPTDYVVSSELSGTPNQIDGSLIATGAIRGKFLAGNNVMDRGTITTAYTAKPANTATTVTISVLDTGDFPSSGAFIYLSPSSRTYWIGRYTGKTATSLTGVSGVSGEVYSGANIVPLFYGVAEISSYTGGSTISGVTFAFPAAGGNAIALGAGITADAFTFTAAQEPSGGGVPELSGVSGLASIGSAFSVVSNPGFPTVTLTAGANAGPLTLSSASTLFENSGGAFAAVRIGSVGYFFGEYRSVSGTSMVLSGDTPLTVTDAGSYILIPIQSNVAIGSRRTLFAYDNSPLSLYIANLSPGDTNLRDLFLRRVIATGYIGSGVAQPLLPIHVAQPTRELARLQTLLTDGSGGFISLFNSSGTRVGYMGFGGTLLDLVVSNDTNGDIVFRTNATIRGRFDSTGRLAINTNAPDALLTVNGAASFGDGAAATPSIANFGDLNTGMWFPAEDTIAWSTGGVERARIDSNGNVLVTGPGGLGYGTGSGGTVVQATSRTTGVTLNKTNGFIYLFNTAGSASWQSFTVSNSTVVGTDTVIVHQRSGTDLYEVHVTAVFAGQFRVTFRTTGGTTTEQPIFVFSIIKSVAA